VRIAYIFRTADASFSVTVSVVPGISRSSQCPILTHHTSTHNLLNPHLTPLPISLTPTPTHLTPAPLPPTKTTNHTQGQHTPSINPIKKKPSPPPPPPLAYASAKPFEFTSSHPNASGIMTTIPRVWVRRCRWAGWKLVGGVGGCSVCRVGWGIVWGFGVGGWKGRGGVGGGYIEG